MMEQQDEAIEEQDAAAGDVAAYPSPGSFWRKAILALAIVLGLLALVAWLSRERIADNIVASQLASYGIPATYKIESVGPQEQVLRDVVIGDKQSPDATIERVAITIRWRLGIPAISRVALLRPRIYGTFHKGALSFGTLDPLLFDQSSSEPPTLPDMDLQLVDGRGLLTTDFGPIGLKAEGSGNLQNGFKGILAANAPQLLGHGCKVGRATLYGEVSVSGHQPQFSGPLRLGTLSCPTQGVLAKDAGFDLGVTGGRKLDSLEATLKGGSGSLAYDSLAAAGLQASANATWRKGALTARYDAVVRGVQSGPAQVALLTGKGSVRGRNGLTRLEWEADWQGNGVRLGDNLAASLRAMEKSSEDTLLAPMIERIRQGLEREGRGSTFAGQTTIRKTPDGLSVIMPQATLRGGTGASLVSISRLQFASLANRPTSLSGNFTTGGLGLPAINGRIQREPDGRVTFRGMMAEYRAGGGALRLPEFVAMRLPDGNIGFAGAVHASGALPGGFADGLVVPIDGNWTANGGLSLWRKCLDIGFDKLVLSGLTLDRRRLQLCPPRGEAIVRSDKNGFRMAAGTPGLDLVGSIGGSPLAIRSGAMGFSWPGIVAARDLDVTLGPAETATHFKLADLRGTVRQGLTGRFSGADFSLYQVPIDVREAAGAWEYANGQLSLRDVSFRAEDRETLDRFEPMQAQGATLSLLDGIVTANAPIVEPRSGRSVLDVAIRHDLNSGAGNADLRVPGIRFDTALQPDMLTALALGVIANADGVISGDGHIGWDANGVTSTGKFTTDKFDFAAAFGPVRGLSGAIRFTDLLGLTTAPNQSFTVASINPGIEVENGIFNYEIQPGYVFQVLGADWPFMDGTLHLEPSRMVLGAEEVRHFTLSVSGLDAAVFVQRMELGNIMATGKFDGRLPLVFDENGGRIEGGALTSRPPGGNISYVGELTYKDLSAMGNFAFDALKSIDYKAMQIDMDGSLAGEIITRVNFDGLSQGQLASKNFLTRQVAKLPIRFVLNIRAPFFSLFGSFKSLYDPTLVADPVSLGLIDLKTSAPAVRSASSHSGNAKNAHGLTTDHAAATTPAIQGRQQ